MVPSYAQCHGNVLRVNKLEDQHGKKNLRIEHLIQLPALLRLKRFPRTYLYTVFETKYPAYGLRLSSK